MTVSSTNTTIPELRFEDLEPIEIPVILGDRRYVLREATGDAVCKWRNHLFKCTRMGPDGKPASIEGMADSDPLLVSLCLFEQHGKDLRRVPEVVVRSWKHRICEQLATEVKRISGLDEPETEEILVKRIQESQKKLHNLRNGNGEPTPEELAKNGQSATTDGSV